MWTCIITTTNANDVYNMVVVGIAGILCVIFVSTICCVIFNKHKSCSEYTRIDNTRINVADYTMCDPYSLNPKQYYTNAVPSYN